MIKNISFVCASSGDKDRIKLLKEITIPSILRQKIPNFDIIVVGEISERLQNIDYQIYCKIPKYVFYAPFRLGFKYAKHNWIQIFGDDFKFPDDWYQKIKQINGYLYDVIYFTVKTPKGKIQPFEQWAGIKFGWGQLIRKSVLKKVKYYACTALDRFFAYEVYKKGYRIGLFENIYFIHLGASAQNGGIVQPTKQGERDIAYRILQKQFAQNKYSIPDDWKKYY